MPGSAVPIGISLNAPLTWVVVGIALIVLMLTLSTRRSQLRPRRSTAGASPPAVTTPVAAPASDQWASAQALFVNDPRAGCERARAIVTRAMRDQRVSFERPELLDRRYLIGCGLSAHPDASTDDLRVAFSNFHAAFDALAASSRAPASTVTSARDEQA
jgi:hypothetical protein